MTALVSTPLVRALRRFAAGDEHEDDAYDETEAGDLSVGVALGTRRSIEGDEKPQLAVWGVLRSAQDAEGMARLMPPGIEPVARFVMLTGSIPRYEDGDSDVVAAFASKALAVDVGAPRDAVLVFVRSTKQLRLYASSSEGVERVTLKEAKGFHARELLRAAGFTMARCAFDVSAFGDADALEQLETWKRTLGDASSVFARVGHRPTSVFDAAGADVMSEKSKGSNPTIGEMLRLDSVTEAAASSKPRMANGSAKSKKKGKKNKPQLDGWDDDGSGADGGNDGDAPGVLPTFEYGDIANVELLTSLSPDRAAAPVLTIPTSRGSDDRRWQLHFDSLVVLPVDAPVSAALSAIRNGLSRQVDELLAHLRSTNDKKTSSISFEHFPLVGASFPLSIATSTGTSSGLATSSYRPAEIHAAFLQPMDRPILDVSRGCSLSSQARVIAESDVLFNVHEGLPPSGIARPPDGEEEQCVLVDGLYGYFHYLQQGVRDKGWGCAYRSLQTLASWLQLNHYTDAYPPTHEQIQRALVRMGDKPATFVGSTEWIGSLEVGYVLDELFGVSFRSLSVPSGARLPELARELQHHFATHGTPVMMGGGQLAFTILGVDYDARSGDCALLILDPHYTGGEDMDVIQSKLLALEGYKAFPCSWRRTSSFSAKSFYNLCLPQRPAYALD